MNLANNNAYYKIHHGKGKRLDALIDLQKALLEQHGTYLKSLGFRVGDAPRLMDENPYVAWDV